MAATESQSTLQIVEKNGQSATGNEGEYSSETGSHGRCGPGGSGDLVV